jgi:hypothetical protein
MEATLVAALTGILGLTLGRFWDRRSESNRWHRNQRVGCYENLVQAYYYVREMIRLLSASQPDSKVSEAAFERARKAGVEWSRYVVNVWLYGSEPVTAAAKELDVQFNHLLHNARNRQLAWDENEWRQQRSDAEACLETLVSKIRKELALPVFPVKILWTPDSSDSPNVRSELGIGLSHDGGEVS